MNTKDNRWRLILAAIVACAITVGGWGFTFILNSNTGLPLHWPAGTVSLRIMLGATKTLADGSTYNSSAQAAAETWNTRMGSIQFQSSTASGSAGDHNQVNEMVFANNVFGRAFDDNVLAVTTSWSSGNERTEGDVVFNAGETWDSYRGARTGSGPFDVQRVAIHELGHLLGMDHPDEATPAQGVGAIMNSRIGIIDTLTPDDIAGIQALYGPPGVPPNNNFASATPIDFNGGILTLAGYNTNATKEPGEPNHAGNAGGRSVWWRWTPSANGTVTLDTKGSYSDTTLAVYTGATLASLASVASDDDIDDGKVQASTVTFQVTANTTYQIAVDGFNGDATGADSSGLTLNFNFATTSGLAPTITTQPSTVTVKVGESATFSVIVTGSAPLSYQWRFNEAAIAGATNSSYSLTNIQTSQAGSYSVVVSNSIGSATSNGASLVVSAAGGGGGGGSGGGGGGGGGGAPSLWFCAVLAALGLGRLLQRSRC